MTASPTDTPLDKRASLSTPRIVFLVIAAAAPLASLEMDSPEIRKGDARAGVKGST